jgi:methylglutaconyl-CoA hydratase
MRASLEFSAEENMEDARRMSDMFHAIDSFPAPVVGRVHGAALGGGMGLIAVCDIVIAAEGTTFGFTETNLGIIPAVISRFVLPKIGESWARALYLTGERFGPDLARQIGLVHWVVAAEDLDSAVDAKVSELLTSGPQATRAAKALVARSRGLDSFAMRELTAERIAAVRTSPEGQEGLRAFLEKRRPGWHVDS